MAKGAKARAKRAQRALRALKRIDDAVVARARREEEPLEKEGPFSWEGVDLLRGALHEAYAVIAALNRSLAGEAARHAAERSILKDAMESDLVIRNAHAAIRIERISDSLFMRAEKHLVDKVRQQLVRSSDSTAAATGLKRPHSDVKHIARALL